ncbi:glycosyltransferase involved in cell wall biosynthesis [Bacillus sp. SLBN-46]|uniref:glycosyltransferase family A protein n=1 Tax=Bacillus sp. SLBN-46 TaxID=3042283 RepID=UPI00285631A7|nr:glycosyltransferase family 2 protein [Bacillus sp. SLBN-46]MDR6121168.1 glycosyltransferase involved in cell wall biosynthesis [Bacillus sp. SLBN-46]
MDKKVSIITPCYNGEDFISRYLNSVLNQTYQNIELILVNDGSTDRTEDIVKSYIPEFKEKGMELIYINQENTGQSGALNKGLQLFTGDYLTWPDSDDILAAESIEKKVYFLEKNRNFGLVRTDAKIVYEGNLSTITGYFARKNPNRFKEDLFLDYIIEDNVWFAPGCYMIRTTSFIDVIPNKQIYPSRAGQNWQMLLPIMFKYKCGFIDEPLYTYVVRSESHSHKITTMKDHFIRCYEHEDILLNTINSIKMNEIEKNKYIKIVEAKYIRKRFYLAIQIRDQDILEREFNLLCNSNYITIKDKVSFFLVKIKLFNIINRLRKVIKISSIEKF